MAITAEIGDVCVPIRITFELWSHRKLIEVNRYRYTYGNINLGKGRTMEIQLNPLISQTNNSKKCYFYFLKASF